MALGFFSCNDNGEKNKINDKPSIKEKIHRSKFKNVAEIIDSDESQWLNINSQDSSCSLGFVFNLVENKDTLFLAAEYSPECWLSFPCKISSNEITVYWDKIIDTKYDFDIVKAINEVSNEYNGKPFMILKLINDTTLEATYSIPELTKKINSSSIQKRTFFPNKLYYNITYVI